MKAVVWSKYGSTDGLQIQEIQKPVPKENEVLIKIHATSVTAGDSEIRRLKFPIWLWIPLRLFMGIRNPRNKILGQEIAGVIEAIGNKVTKFNVGDQVYATTGLNFGGYSQYLCLSSTSMISIKPKNMTYEEAAVVPVGGMAALQFVRKANIQKGQKVLIYAASGSIGTFSVQLAKHYGAEITAVGNPTSLELLKSLGAENVINYKQEDFTKNGETYDIIFDAIGKSPFPRSMKSLKPKGMFLSANPKIWQMFLGLWIRMITGKKVLSAVGPEKSGDLEILKELIESEKVKSVIDRQYPLDQMPEAHNYVDKAVKTGNVAITIDHDD